MAASVRLLSHWNLVVQWENKYASMQGPCSVALHAHRRMVQDMEDAHEQWQPGYGIKGPPPTLTTERLQPCVVPPSRLHDVPESVTQWITKVCLMAIGWHLQEVEDHIQDLGPPISFCHLRRPMRGSIGRNRVSVLTFPYHARRIYFIEGASHTLLCMAVFALFKWRLCEYWWPSEC